MKMQLSGLIEGMSNEAYHSIKDRLSSTGLKELARSPAHYQAYISEIREPTKAMKFGTGFHELIGEPELFSKKYAKGPSKTDYPTALFTADDLKKKCEELGLKPGRTKADTARLLVTVDSKIIVWDRIVAEYEKINAGKEILSSDEYDALDGMLASILKNKKAVELLTNGKAEQSAFWIDPETGVQCKCRPDYLRNDGIIVDLKTTKDARLREFQKTIAEYAYHLQSAFYLDGVSHVLGEPLNEFVHVVVEKTAPYNVAIYVLDDAALRFGRDEIKRLLALYVECSKKNEWKGYDENIQNVSLPGWME